MSISAESISSIGTSGPDIVGSIGRGYTLADTINREQLNKMTVQSQQEEQADLAKLKTIGQKYDLSKPEDRHAFAAEATKISPKLGMDVLKTTQEADRRSSELSADQMRVYEAKHEAMTSALIPMYQQIDTLTKQGVPPQMIEAQLLPVFKQTLDTLQKQTLPNGEKLLNQQDIQQISTMLSGQPGALLQGINAAMASSRTAAQFFERQRKANIEERKVNVQEESARTRAEQGAERLDIARGRAGGGGRPKPPAGYEWDPDDPESLRFIPGGPKDPTKSPIFGREGVMFSRVASSANEAVAAIKNIVELPIGASSGVFGIGASPGHGIMSSNMGALTNELASQDVQDYNTMLAGVRRNLATIETAGLAPSGALTEGFASLELRAGDTELTKMRKLAEMRQVVEKGLEVNLDNPRLPQEQKTLVQRIINDVKTAVPFTQHDVTEFQKAGKKNSETTLTDYMKQKGLTQPVNPTPAATTPQTGPPPPSSPSSGGGGPSAMDQQALAWANAHPNDPRAAAIKQRLGAR